MPSRARTAAMAVVAVVTLTGCLDDGVPDLESGPVLAALDRPGSSASGTTALDVCPISDFEELIENSVELVDEPVVRAALDGAGDAEVISTTSPDLPSPVLRCELSSPAGVIGIRATVSPGERSAHEQFGVAVDAVDAGTRGDVTSFLSDVYRGGEFIRVCIDHGTGGAPESCAVDWVDRGDLDADERADDDEPRALVGLYIRGDGALDLNLREVEERWRLMLPLVIQRLE